MFGVYKQQQMKTIFLNNVQSTKFFHNTFLFRVPRKISRSLALSAQTLLYRKRRHFLIDFLSLNYPLQITTKKTEVTGIITAIAFLAPKKTETGTGAAAALKRRVEEEQQMKIFQK